MREMLARRLPADRALLLFLALLLLFVSRIGAANVALGLTLVAAGWRMWRHGPPSLPQAPILAPLAGYALFSVLCAFAAHQRGASLTQTSELLALLLVPLVLTTVRGVREARAYLDLLVAMGALLAVWGLGQFLWQAFSAGDTTEYRIRGPLSHYMTFSGILLIAALVALALAAFDTAAPRSRRLWYGAAAAFMIAAILASLTRNAWLGLAAGAALIAGVRRRELLLYSVPAFYLFLLFAPLPLFARTLSIFDARARSNYDRLCMARAGARMVRDNPLWGVGLGQVKRRYALYREADAPRFRLPHLHNNAVQIGAERGLLALGSYLWFLGALGAGLWRRWHLAREAEPQIAVLLLACGAALLGITVAGFFEFNFGDAEVLLLTLFVAALPFTCERELRALAPAS